MTQKKTLLLLLWAAVAVLWLLACGGGNGGNAEESADSALYIPRADLARTNRLETTSGKTWIVGQTPMLDTTLVSVVVNAIGFSSDTLSFDLGETDPVTELRLEDLDKDGFQELYIVTQAAGPEAFGTLYGLYSERDSSVIVIAFEGASPYTMKEGEAYVGYRGHDQFRFEKGILTNTIPVFLTDDTDAMPSGGSKTITYELFKGPATMRLRPVKRK